MLRKIWLAGIVFMVLLGCVGAMMWACFAMKPWVSPVDETISSEVALAEPHHHICFQTEDGKPNAQVFILVNGTRVDSMKTGKRELNVPNGALVEVDGSQTDKPFSIMVTYSAYQKTIQKQWWVDRQIVAVAHIS